MLGKRQVFAPEKPRDTIWWEDIHDDMNEEELRKRSRVGWESCYCLPGISTIHNLKPVRQRHQLFSRMVWYCLTDIYIVHSFFKAMPNFRFWSSFLMSIVLVVAEMEVVVLSITNTEQENDGVDKC